MSALIVFITLSIAVTVFVVVPVAAVGRANADRPRH
mgnify:CR=1 FL=1|jgi:hypothetical protein